MLDTIFRTHIQYNRRVSAMVRVRVRVRVRMRVRASVKGTRFGRGLRSTGLLLGAGLG